jgi:hypothetical protein
MPGWSPTRTASSCRGFADWQNAPRKKAVWAPEFYRFPRWVRGADLMFAEASSWSRPIRFVGGCGGHAATLDVAQRARRAGVRRLVFAHVGRPTIRALDKGEALPFGSSAAKSRPIERATRSSARCAATAKHAPAG